MNLAWRDVRHNLFRFVLTCLGLSLLMTVVLAMIGIYNGLIADALNIVRAPKADLWVVEAGTQGPFAEASRIPGETADAVSRLHGVTAAGGVTYQTVETEFGGAALRLYVIGHELGRPGGPQTIAEGRALSRSHFELVADRKAGMRPGDTVRLGRNRFTVVGLVEATTNSAGDPVVFMTLADAQVLQAQLAPPAQRVQALRGAVIESPTTLAAVVARLAPDADADAVAESVRRWKHLGAMTQAQQETLLLQSVVDRARRQIGLFLGILMAVSAVVIALIIYTMTMEKLKQIATLKLIGAPDRVIVGLIVQQSLALGLAGWGFGLALILLIKDGFPRRVVLETGNVMMLGAIVVVVCLLASGLGVRAALKVDPATAIGG